MEIAAVCRVVAAEPSVALRMRADAAKAVPAGFLAGSDAEAASHFTTSGKDGGWVLVGHTEDYAAYLPVAVSGP